MSNIEEFSFTKKDDIQEKDQKKFEKLPPKEKEEFINKSQEEVEDTNKERNELIQELKESVLDHTENVTEVFQKAKDSLTEPEIKNIFQENLEEKLSGGDTYRSKNIVDFAQREEIALDFSTPAIQESFQRGLEKTLSEGYTDSSEDIIKLAKENSVPLNFSRPEVKDSLQKGLEKTLLNGYDISIVEDITRFSQRHDISLDFSSPEVKNGFQKELEKTLSEGRIKESRYTTYDNSEKIIKIARENNVPLDLSRPEVKDSLQKGLEKTLLNGYIDYSKEIVKFSQENKIPLDFSTPGVEKALQKRLTKAISNGETEYIQIATEFIRDNSPVADDIINKSIDNFLDKKLERWRSVAGVLSAINSLSKEKLENKNIRDKIILKLTERIGDLQSTEVRDDIEISLLNTRNQLKKMLQNYLPESDVFGRQLIENLYNKIPSAGGNLIQDVRNDAINLQNLDDRLFPVRKLIHNYPNQNNLKIINGFIGFLQCNPQEENKKKDALRSAWFSDPVMQQENFYSDEELNELKQNPNILKAFDKLKNDLEKIWSSEGSEEKMKEKTLHMPENIKKDIEEVTHQTTPDNKGAKGEHKDIARAILTAREDINEAIRSKKGVIIDEYALDEMLKQEAYKNYGEWQNSIKEINKENLPDAVNMLKSTLSEMKTDGLINKSLQRAEIIIDNLNLDSKENLSKLYSQINVINKEISKTFDSLRKEFSRLIEETYPDMPPAEKEVLFSQFYKNNAIDFASKISSRLERYLRSQNVTLDKQEEEHQILQQFHQQW